MTAARVTAPRGNGEGGTLQAVLFDMDGVLIDSEPLWYEVETKVMARLGGTWTPADQRALLGGSLDRSTRYLLERAGSCVPLADVAEWLLGGMAGRVRDQGVPVLPGARELVAEVAAAGLPYALVTSSRRRIVDAVLDRTALRFPVVVCAEDVRRNKPDPESYLLAASRLGAAPGRCVVLEDSPTGVAAAEAAGCPVVAVPSISDIGSGPGRVVVNSLAEVDVALLRAVSRREDVPAGGHRSLP